MLEKVFHIHGNITKLIMMKLSIKIDDLNVEVNDGQTILEAAGIAGIYIPAICHHPDLPSYENGVSLKEVFRGDISVHGTSGKYQGCGVCLVEVEGEGVKTSCNTMVKKNMVIHTNTPAIIEQRQNALSEILSKHPHACLLCPQHEGCGLIQCISNVPEEERCCQNFNVCELKKVATYIGIKDDIPRFKPKNLPVIEDEPLFVRDYNLCIDCTRCVRVCNEVRAVGALAFTVVEGKAVVGTKALTLKDSGCKFCGACVEVCPTGALMDKGIIWADRGKALVPCRNKCPAGVDVPEYVRLICKGKFSEAAAVVYEKVPFAATLGRVCFHPCEDVCRRADIDKPISIRELKRFALENDTGFWKEKVQILPSTGKKVAIIGSGPAGLTCGSYLVQQGHSVIVYEALPKPGGMMRYGIPEYRLPQKVLDKEIETLIQLGVNIQTESRIESIGKLFTHGFDAVFIAIGLQKGSKLGINGEDNQEVLDGISFLRDVSLGKKVKLGEKVAVIGGGNVAIDVSRTSLRVGAKEVCILYRRTEAEMPAYQEEIVQVLDEGIKIQNLIMPINISKSHDKSILECQRMELSNVDESGRKRPVPVKDSEFNMEFDNILIAVGQRPEFLEGSQTLIDNSGKFCVDTETLATSMKGVFAGGDIVSGASTVIDAIAIGTKGANSIDQFLGGDGIIEQRFVDRAELNPYMDEPDGLNISRQIPISYGAKEGVFGFNEVAGCYTEKQAVAEAGRCLQCDLRLQILSPNMPPEKWLEINENNLHMVPNTEGVLQLFDTDKNLICIKGTMELAPEIKGQLERLDKAKYFIWEVETMYAKRESELLQQYMQLHGGLPDGNTTELDDDLY